MIITVPAPQAADLLQASGADPTRASTLRAVASHPAVMTLAGFAVPAPTGLDPFTVAAAFTRITNECAKGRPPVDGVVPVVAQLPPRSRPNCWTPPTPTSSIGCCPRWRPRWGPPQNPDWVQVKRWRYGDPVAPTDPVAVNASRDRIRVAGDSIALGLAAVAESGLRAAPDLTAIL